MISRKFRRVVDNDRPRVGEIAATGPAFVLNGAGMGPHACPSPHPGVPNRPFSARRSDAGRRRHSAAMADRWCPSLSRLDQDRPARGPGPSQCHRGWPAVQPDALQCADAGTRRCQGHPDSAYRSVARQHGWQSQETGIRQANGADLGGLMIRAGWARDYPRYSSGHYGDDERAARDAGSGAWAADCMAPWEWRRQR